MNALYKTSFYVLCMQVVHGVNIEPAHEVKKRSINQQLRILLHYDDSVYRFVCIYFSSFSTIESLSPSKEKALLKRATYNDSKLTNQSEKKADSYAIKSRKKKPLSWQTRVSCTNVEYIKFADTYTNE